MRVNMDSSIASDPRFKLVAAKLKVKWTEVIGSCFLLWLACYDRRSECLRKVEADVSSELSGFADALVAEGLADDLGDGTIRIHGVSERIKFLQKQAESGAKGGKSKAKNKGKRVLKQTLSERQASATASALANTPDQDQSLSPDLAQSLSPSEGAREARGEFMCTASMVEAVYAHYPKKTGKAKGIPKVVKAIETQEQFDRFEACVMAMEKAWEGHDVHWAPGFEPFATGRRWEDEAWPMPSEDKGASGGTGQAQRLYDLSEEMREAEEAAEAAESAAHAAVEGSDDERF